MLVHKCRYVIILVLLVGFTGCQDKKQSSPSLEQGAKVLARVNGTPLTAEDVAFRVELAHGNKPEYGDKTIDDVINQELLCQQGIKLGLDKDPSFRTKDKLPPAARRNELARRVFNTQIAALIDVRYQDGKEYFDKNTDMILSELHLEMIKFDKRPEAEAALKKLRGGAVFESIARPVMGETPVDGRKPWDLGFVKWDKIPVDFVGPIYSLKVGQVSDILGSQRTGFQLVKLIERRKIPKVDYPAVSAPVMNRLRDQKLLESYNHYIEGLRKDAKIEKY